MTSCTPCAPGVDPQDRPAASHGPASRWQRLAPLWQRVRRPLGWAFLALVAGLLWHQGRQLDWRAALRAVQALPATALAAAALLALASHAVYACFDLVGRHLVQHRLGRARTMAVAFVSYAFNLNLGSLIGGIGFRLQLYSRLGLSAAQIAQVLGSSLATNWLGYLALAGLVLASGQVAWPADWVSDPRWLQLAGIVVLAVVPAYALACLRLGGRRLNLRGHEITLPGIRVAGLQLLLSCTNWALMAGIVYSLLGGHVAYPMVLATLLAAAVAGVVTHVPAGLGVVEAVFIAMLGARVPQGELLAALLVYRVLYYLLPLGAAVAVHGLLATSGDLENADRHAVGKPGTGADEQPLHHPGEYR